MQNNDFKSNETFKKSAALSSLTQEKQTIESKLSLRLAGESDETFLATVYAATRTDELAMFGWSAEQQFAFCQMQFRLQTQAYKMQFPDAVCYVVEFDEKACGRLLVARNEQEIRLIDVALLPEFRNQGAGKILIENLQREAEAANKSLNLRVLRDNSGAFRLYAKLGFVVVEESQTHFTMQWRAAANK